MAATINFNGKEYNSVDEMPPDIRAAYEALINAFADEDHNGMPDIFEGKGSAQVMNLGNVFSGQTSFSKIIYEGKAYSSPDELPPAARAKYDQAIGKLGEDENRNGIPDVLEQSTPVVNVTRQFSFGKPTLTQRPTMSMAAPTGSNDTRLFLLGIALVVLLLVVMALLAIILTGPMLLRR